MAQEKKSGIKLHIGVGILGLPQAIMLTTAEVSGRSGAIEMVEYYCDVTDNVSLMKKVLADGGYTGEPFTDTIKSLSGTEVEVAKRSGLHTLPSFRNAGLQSVLLAGLINAAGFGKIVNGNYRIHFKW